VSLYFYPIDRGLRAADTSVTFNHEWETFMNDKAMNFVNDWVRENVNATGYEPEGDNTEAKILATQCHAAAAQAGISAKAIEEACGDLVDYIAGEISSTNDAEVARLAARDD
jgi:hypothetical protein